MDETGEKTSDQVQETHAGAYEKNMTDALSKLCRFIFVFLVLGYLAENRRYI